MKKFTLLICLLIYFQSGNAQLTFGISTGYSPAVHPKTSGVVVNRKAPLQEMLFNAIHVKSSPQIGGMFLLDLKPFWVMAEVWGKKEETTWTLRTAIEPREQEFFKLNRYKVHLPVSIGCDIGGGVQFFSGFSLDQILRNENELNKINGYSETTPLSGGWHGGAGIRLNKLLLQVRYSQSFQNYGAKQFYKNESLALYNAPGKLLFSITSILN